MNNQSFTTLEYNIVLGIISFNADSQDGGDLVRKMLPLKDASLIERRLTLTEEVGKFISLYAGFGLSEISGLEEILQKKNIAGSALEIEEVSQVERTSWRLKIFTIGLPIPGWCLKM